VKLVVSPKVLLLDVDGNALILRRSKTHPKRPFGYDLPGGLVDDGEDITEALLREIQEETGLILEKQMLSLVHGQTYYFPPKEGVEATSMVRLLYIARLGQAAPTITLSWEHDLFEWRKLSAITDMSTAVQTSIDYCMAHSLLEVL
jgi:8-oxo-dGTP pyrophosphatase MutT (NUDIX family)